MDACRILNRLWEAEKSEPDIHLRSDYRQAFICVSLAASGNAQPFVDSSYTCYGTHPDHVWRKILANRTERLEDEYKDWYFQDGTMRPDVPKKNPSIYIDEQAERAAKERLAGVLAFPKTAVHFAELAEKQKTGTLYEMPPPAQIAARQSLRILPVEDAG